MEELKLNINQDYAKKFHKTKEREELFKLKQKFGEDAQEISESSSSESEDEAAKEVTVQKEKDFLKVLSLIKKKDPAIYDKTANFYSEDSGELQDRDIKKEKETQKKPVYLKDYERQRLMEKGSMAFVSDEENEDDHDAGKENGSLSYVEEQKSLKQSFKVALQGPDDDDEEFLKVRKKTAAEKEQEEYDYIEWLRGNKKSSGSTDMSEMETLQRYWTDPNLDEDEQFLRDYILNRDYIDKDMDRIPTYNEIVGDEEDDEEEVEKQEEFERKYNFRYEEPDAEFIKAYPRTVSGSVRRKDERRKEKRKQREERKEKEKEQKREELKRLKNLKRKEILEKLEKIKEITGNPNVGFSEEDLEADFDPEKYDEAMKNMFDDDYYEDDDEEKPEFEDDLDLEENWDDWQGEEEEAFNTGQISQAAHSEDPDFNMDADYDDYVQVGEVIPAGNKRKGASRFAQALSRKKPKFNPDEKTFEEYFDEYYKLDYEDIVGDLPCRFKYRQVVPNDFGLTTEEVLSCPDKELNQWVSVKKMSQFRTEYEERQDVKKYGKRARDSKRKTQVLVSLATNSDEGESQQETKEESSGTEKTKKSKRDITKANKHETSGTSNDQESHENVAVQETKEKDSSEKEGKKSEELPRKLTKKRTVSVLAKLRGFRFKRQTYLKTRKERAAKNRLAKYFKGARKEQLGKLSVDRLASYGLDKKKKKH